MSSETKCGKPVKTKITVEMGRCGKCGSLYTIHLDGTRTCACSRKGALTLEDVMKIKKTFDDNEKGVKHDNGKRQWALVPWRELGQVADVLTFGAKKYSPDNWMHVPGSERRYFEAAMRHITARQSGEINDPKSEGGDGLPHLAHAICCLLFWAWHDNKNRRGHL